ncbi:hypothetical protein V0242_25015 (plasmid) [Aeromonas hydrophila]|uniref:hypothetical protein n=1 Tax=Aeromonas hydrophila TaxID=644 RepID=UPI002ED2995C|nr:hypothetical protein V0242_25015 [Aeromonas hydrophila]
MKLQFNVFKYQIRIGNLWVITMAYIELDPSHRNYCDDDDAEIDRAIAECQLRSAGWSGKELVDGSIFTCDAVYYFCEDTGQAGAVFVQHSTIKPSRSRNEKHLLSIPLTEKGVAKIDPASEREFARSVLAQAWSSNRAAGLPNNPSHGRMHVVVRFDRRRGNKIAADVKIYQNDDLVLPFWRFMSMMGVEHAHQLMQRNPVNVLSA